MKLHLYQDIRYLSVHADYTIDPIESLNRFIGLCSSAGISCKDDELILSVPHSTSENPLFGTSPFVIEEDSLPEDFFVFTLKAGDYAFHQFSDITNDGIDKAIQLTMDTLIYKHWEPAGTIVYLRGVKESSTYAMQVLIPLQ